MVDVSVVAPGDVYTGAELAELFAGGWEFPDDYKNVWTECLKADIQPRHDRVALLSNRPNGFCKYWFEDLVVNPQNQYVVRDVIDGYLLDISPLN